MAVWLHGMDFYACDYGLFMALYDFANLHTAMRQSHNLESSNVANFWAPKEDAKTTGDDHHLRFQSGICLFSRNDWLYGLHHAVPMCMYMCSFVKLSADPSGKPASPIIPVWSPFIPPLYLQLHLHFNQFYSPHDYCSDKGIHHSAHRVALVYSIFLVDKPIFRLIQIMI